ncbi:AlpA family phage regulatory protein [Paenibacillus sp. USDA918EY]|uniref:AlpA family phage regulatory protein n=1 Tax=Paenibacillus sp. USDA918EY TaxID=2689575 RepID=UPI0013593E17|nr:AlpA family phage regulatory protein [Paenibacillus sp. USDA918EY]
MERSDLPIILQAKHIIQVTGLSKSSVYELMKSPDFPLLELNERKLVYRDRFFEWLDSKQRVKVRVNQP